MSDLTENMRPPEPSRLKAVISPLGNDNYALAWLQTRETFSYLEKMLLSASAAEFHGLDDQGRNIIEHLSVDGTSRTEYL